MNDFIEGTTLQHERGKERSEGANTGERTKGTKEETGEEIGEKAGAEKGGVGLGTSPEEMGEIGEEFRFVELGTNTEERQQDRQQEKQHGTLTNGIYATATYYWRLLLHFFL